MEVQKDFRELLELLNKNNVEYIIVGAYALAFHGIPRFTGDLDVWVKPEKKNAGRLLASLNEFGFGSIGIKEEDFYNPGKVIQLGVPPVRIDLITSLTGITWEEAFLDKIKGSYGDLDVYYLGKTQIIKNKKALGRKKDLADLEALGEN